MTCEHIWKDAGKPKLIFHGFGGAGIRTVTIRQPMECVTCHIIRYRWSKYHEDESSVAYREQ